MVAAGFIVRLNLNKYSVFRAFISTGKSVILDSPNTLDAESITEEKVSDPKPGNRTWNGIRSSLLSHFLALLTR